MELLLRAFLFRYLLSYPIALLDILLESDPFGCQFFYWLLLILFLVYLLFFAADI